MAPPEMGTQAPAATYTGVGVREAPLSLPDPAAPPDPENSALRFLASSSSAHSAARDRSWRQGAAASATAAVDGAEGNGHTGAADTPHGRASGGA